MTALYHAHSGLRYLVLLVGVIALLAFAYGLATNKPVRAARGLTAAFTGLLDVQILLGVGLAMGGIFYGKLMGHISMMLAAAIVAHLGSLAARRTTDERRALLFRAGGILLALLCIVAGIMAIGRSPLGSAAATVVR